MEVISEVCKIKITDDTKYLSSSRNLKGTSISYLPYAVLIGVILRAMIYESVYKGKKPKHKELELT